MTRQRRAMRVRTGLRVRLIDTESPDRDQFDTSPLREPNVLLNSCLVADLESISSVVEQVRVAVD